jgi:hypothetical protein
LNRLTFKRPNLRDKVAYLRVILDAELAFDPGGDINQVRSYGSHGICDIAGGQAAGEAETDTGRPLGEGFPRPGGAIAGTGVKQR